MASTTFVDGETLIEASWLNDVNAAVYTEKQPLDATLTALAGWANGIDKIPYTSSLDVVASLDYSIDGTFAANVDTKIPSEKASKTYIDNKVSTSIAAISYSGHIKQVQYASTTEVATDIVNILYDDTIPQNTEGTQYLSVTITPTSTTNKLLIEASCNCAGSASGVHTIALFQDDTAGALAVGSNNAGDINVQTQVSLSYYMTSGTTSAITFKIRGGATAGTQTLNGVAGARYFGGVFVSYLKVTEIVV